MSRLSRLGESGAQATDSEAAGPVPGKQTLTERLPAGGGAPLPPAVGDRFAASLGGGVADVRVHDDAASHAAAASMGAQAFATGNDIHFAASTYDPGSAGGQELLAHEVVHTQQQRAGGAAVQQRRVVGAAGDAAEHEADRLAPSVMAGTPVAVTAAPGGAIQRRPDPKAAAPDPKEAAWASPSRTEATEPAHVGAVFFHTKRHDLEAADEAVLRQLAKAYAPWAKRNIGKHGAPLGLKGSVVGYADPRPSHEPNNQQLSLERAHWTAMKLARALAAETGLAEGDFDISEKGGGVEAVADAAGAEDPLPHSRRADIFLDGKAGDDAPQGEKAPAPADAPKPPVVKGWEDNDFDRFEAEIRNGDKRTIRSLALRMVGNLMVDTAADQLYYAPAVTGLVGKGRLEPFDPIKPPWWDGRTSQVDIGQGRGASARGGMVYKMLLLKRDYKETIFYDDTEFRAHHGVYLRMMQALHDGTATPELLAEAHQKLGYLLFMLDSVKTDALAMSKLADD